jgi:hypothetical protein
METWFEGVEECREGMAKEKWLEHLVKTSVQSKCGTHIFHIKIVSLLRMNLLNNISSLNKPNRRENEIEETGERTYLWQEMSLLS